MAKKLFTSENQPQRKSGQWFKTKVVDSLKRQGMTEEGFMDLLVVKAIEDGGVYMTELLKRYSPIPKQTHEPITIEFPKNGTPAEKANAVLDAMAAGDISPDIGQIFIEAISKSLGIEELTELAKRLEALEAIINAKEA
jgi:hypothetical protein